MGRHDRRQHPRCSLRIAAALPVFQRQGSGHIINISSTAALQLAPAMAVYAAAKQAVATISEGLRREMAGMVRVTVIYPGMTNTNFASTMTNPDLRAPLEKRRLSQSLPPDVIAQAAAALRRHVSGSITVIIARARKPHPWACALTYKAGRKPLSAKDR